MNQRDERQIVDDYLGRLARALDGIPAAARSELLEDVRSHIEEAWAASPERDRSALLNILERLGQPETLAAEERERLGLSPPPTPAGFLEVMAIVLTALFWPVGILLAWLSTAWSVRDKLIATAIPLVGMVLLLVTLVPARLAYEAQPVVVTRVETVVKQEVEAPSTVVPQLAPPTGAMARFAIANMIAVTALLLGLVGTPFTSAIYLAWQLRHRASRGVKLAALLVLAVLLLPLLLILPSAVSRLAFG